jgi:hypothetical protein
VEFDVTDKGTFAGVALRDGVKAIRAPLIPLEGEPDTLVTDSRGWMHVFPLTLGLDADRTFKNRDVLFEAAYLPFKGSPAIGCFKVGCNPVVGVVGQLGHRTRDPSLNDTQSSLRRVKVELAMDMLLSSCLPSLGSGAEGRAKDSNVLGLIARDIGQWRVMLEGTRGAAAVRRTRVSAWQSPAS